MSKQYKIVVPKAGKASEDGSLGLYEAGTVVTADESWKEDLMVAFQNNGWAMEVKVQDTSDMERARDKKGHFVPDDLSTPEVNEAYIKKVVPKKKRAPKAK